MGSNDLGSGLADFSMKLGIVLLLLFIGGGIRLTSAQAPNDEDTRRKAEAEVRIAEAQARAAEAQARSAEANSRSSEIENRRAELDLLRANTTVSGDLIENDISAYKAVSCAAADINRQLRTVNTQIDLLMIYSPRFGKTMAEYSVVINQMERLKAKYDDTLLLPQAYTKTDPNGQKTGTGDIAAIVNPAKQFSALAIDTLALFKTDVDIQSRNVIIGKDEFIAKLLNGVSLEVYYPEKMIPMNNGDSRLLNLLADLAEERVKSEYLLQKKTEINENALERIAPTLEALNAIYDNIITQFFQMSKPADDDQPSGAEGEALNQKRADYNIPRRSIIEYMRAELATGIMNAQDNKRKYWLDVHVTKAASNQRNKSSAIVDIFTGGKRLSFSGGSIVNFRLFDSNGKVIASDTILTYIPYKQSKRLAGYKCQRVMDIL